MQIDRDSLKVLKLTKKSDAPLLGQGLTLDFLLRTLMNTDDLLVHLSSSP